MFTWRNVVAWRQQAGHTTIGVGPCLPDRVPGGAAAAVSRALQLNQHAGRRPPQRSVQHMACDWRRCTCITWDLLGRVVALRPVSNFAKLVCCRCWLQLHITAGCCSSSGDMHALLAQ